MIDHPIIKPGRMGLLPAKMPCAECPLARASTPGFLGGYTVLQYLEILHSVADIACHMSKGFPVDTKQQRSCTGVAMFRANAGISPSGHALEAMQQAGPNRDVAFASAAEFASHHLTVRS